MDKLSVLIDDELEKDAAGEVSTTCPRCGSPLLPTDESNVPRCPKCGTEPFEAR